MAQILDGKATAAKIRTRLKSEIAAHRAAGLPQPHVVFIQLGSNPASTTYVDTKHKMASRIGCLSGIERYGEDTTQAQLLARIAELNADAAVHAILVQLPMPRQIDTPVIIRAIDPAKDVDCFHPVNVGLMATGLPGPKPATPQGVLMLLDEYGIEVAGKRAAVVGRSNLVGKPLGLLLLARDATVTYCHSKTPDLASVLGECDIVCTAVGQPGLVRADMIREGAVVIDVGMNYVRSLDGSGEPQYSEQGEPVYMPVGDCDYAGIAAKAAWVTPVPGGVGPMTIASVLWNTLVLYRQQLGLAD